MRKLIVPSWVNVNDFRRPNVCDLDENAPKPAILATCVTDIT